MGVVSAPRLPIFRYGIFPFLWLVYALAVPVSMWVRHESAATAQMQLAAFATFITLYVLGYGRRGGAALGYAVAFAALGALATVSNVFAACYFIYGAAFIAYGFETTTAYRVLIFYCLLALGFTFVTQIDPVTQAAALVFSLVVGSASIKGAEQSQNVVTLRSTQKSVEHRAKIEERERIARDLHDVLGHTLTLIALKAELARSHALEAGGPANAVDEIQEVERIARASLQELRAAVSGYKTGGIEDELKRAQDALTSLGVTVRCDADAIALPPAQEAVLVLAVREAVTNVMRHARASSVTMQLQAFGGVCRFDITDDGVGGADLDGFGLSGMRERLKERGGSVECLGGTGTHLVMTLPIAQVQ